jgi:hypothetical protein
MRKVFNFLWGVIFFSAGMLSAQESITFENLPNMKNERYGLGYTSAGKYIYLVDGGSFDFRGFLDNIDIFDTDNLTWKRSNEKLIPRRYLNAEYVPALNKLFIFNGEFSNNKTYNLQANLYAAKSRKKFTDIMEIVDLNSNKVTTSISNPHAVRYAGSAVWENKIYVFGGWDPRGYSNMLYVYDPLKDEWTRLADMPEARQTKGVIVDGILYTFGGSDNDISNYNTIHAYNIKENKWSLVGELPERISANAVASDGKNIWLVGAYNNINFLAAFDTKTKTVKTFKSNMIGRRHAGAQVINNKLYVFGGNQTPDARTALTSVQRTDISKFKTNN